jgi:hypothetical protein
MTDTAEKKVARFVDVPGKSRTKIVDLDWPLEFDGKTYSSVTIRRATIGEWRTFWDEVAEGKDPYAPWFVEPREVMDALDPDDDAKVADVVDGFFPDRYRAKTEKASASASQDGVTSQPNSEDTSVSVQPKSTP